MSIDPSPVDDLARRLSRLLPPGADRLRDQVSDNVRALMEAALDRMDLVTREEFEIQAAVLARTREKLERLEARIAALESGQPPSL